MAWKPVPLISLFILAGLLDAPPGAMADEKEQPSRILEIERLKEEIYAINLINRLGLTAGQIEAILERAELARPYIAACRESLPEIYRDQVEAFREFKIEDEADRGFSIQVEQNTHRANVRERDLKNKLIQRLNEISRPLFEVLNPDQLEIIEDYRPVIFPAEAEQAALSRSLTWRYETIRETLLEVLRLKDGAYRSEKERLARRILNAFPRRRDPGNRKKVKEGGRKRNAGQGRIEGSMPEDLETAEEALARILGVMDLLRGLPEDQAEAELDEIIIEKICPPRVMQMEREMREVLRSMNPALNPLSHYLLNTDVMPYLEKLKERSRRGPSAGRR